MNHAAVTPRVGALANSSDMIRHDGRNRRSAETRRKIIEAAKTMITETGTAPPWWAWQGAPTCRFARYSSISATSSHFL